MTQTAPPKIVYNSVTFTGNLGKNPEMHYTGNGNAVTKFSLAVSMGKDKGTMWLTIETWKDLAEQCNEKLTKGTFLEVKGRLAQESWEKEGRKQYAFKVIAQTIRVIKRATKQAATGFIEENAESVDPLGDLDDHPF